MGMSLTRPISIRYTDEELKTLDEAAKLCGMSRAEVIHQRSLGKILTLHEMADWAERVFAAGSAKTSTVKKKALRRAPRIPHVV